MYAYETNIYIYNYIYMLYIYVWMYDIIYTIIHVCLASRDTLATPHETELDKEHHWDLF